MKSLDGSDSVQLNWEVNRDSGIDSFELFRGSSMDDMELYDTIGGDNRQFSDPEPLNGATFYAVRAVETDGEMGELSNPVSFYRAQDTLKTHGSLLVFHLRQMDYSWKTRLFTALIALIF